MQILEYIEQNKISKYRFAKDTGIPYSTLLDILSEKTSIEKCSAETVYKLAKKLGVSMETLLVPYLEKRCSFELFKSNVCHKLQRLGDIDFIIETLKSGEIRSYYERKWYPECFYLLAMLDYISRINQVPLCDEYNDLRCQTLSKTIYPTSIIALSEVLEDESIKKKAEQEAIPEFMRFNIVESEVRNIA